MLCASSRQRRCRAGRAGRPAGFQVALDPSGAPAGVPRAGGPARSRLLARSRWPSDGTAAGGGPPVRATAACPLPRTPSKEVRLEPRIRCGRARARDAHMATCRTHRPHPHQAGCEVQECRLTGPVGAHQTGDPSCRNPDRTVTKRPGAAITLTESGRLDRRNHATTSIAFSRNTCAKREPSLRSSQPWARAF